MFTVAPWQASWFTAGLLWNAIVRPDQEPTPLPAGTCALTVAVPATV